MIATPVFSPLAQYAGFDAPSGSGSSFLKRKTITITASEYAALSTTPKTLVAGITGAVLRPLSINIFTNVSAAFSANSTLTVEWETLVGVALTIGMQPVVNAVRLTWIQSISQSAGVTDLNGDPRGKALLLRANALLGAGTFVTPASVDITYYSVR